MKSAATLYKYFFATVIICVLPGCFEHKSRFDDEPGMNDQIHADIDSPDIDRKLGEDRFHWQRPDFVIDQLGDISDKKIADLGAGSGYFSFRLVKKAAGLIAIDIDPEMIKLLEEEKEYYSDEIKARFEARLASPNDPGLNPQEVDIILLVNTYAYIEDRVNYFKKLKTALKPGGLLMIVDFKKRKLPIGPEKEFKVSLTRVEEELTAAGYKSIVSDDYSLAYQYIVKAYAE